MKNKRGQFYIVAAIIIVLAISGLASVVTYAYVKAKPRTMQSMGNELREEGSRIVDYGIYNKENIIEYLNNFTESYAEYFLKKTNNANVIFVYGNKTNLFAVKYDNVSTGLISANIGNGATNWNMFKGVVNRTNVIVNPTETNVQVKMFNNDYNFNLKESQMFYFVIIQEREGEVYVEENSQ